MGYIIVMGKSVVNVFGMAASKKHIFDKYGSSSDEFSSFR